MKAKIQALARFKKGLLKVSGNSMLALAGTLAQLFCLGRSS
jgi:hypothetical protein